MTLTWINADSDEVAPAYRDDVAPGFRHDVATGAAAALRSHRWHVGDAVNPAINLKSFVVVAAAEIWATRNVVQACPQDKRHIHSVGTGRRMRLGRWSPSPSGAVWPSRDWVIVGL